MKLLRTIFLSFLLIPCSLPLFSQNSKIDSLKEVISKAKDDTNKVKSLNALSRLLYRKSEYAQGDTLANQAIRIASALNYKPGLVASYRLKGLIDYDLGNYIEGLKNHTLSMNIATEIGDKKSIGTSYGNIGNIYWAQGNYAEALKNHLLSLKMAEEVNDQSRIAAEYGNVGLVYGFTGNNTEALKYQLLALKKDIELGDKDYMANTYVNIGNIYYNQNNYPEALKNHTMALKLDEEAGNDMGLIADYINIAHIYCYQKNYENGLANYMKSLRISERIGNKANITIAYESMGDVFISERKYAEAQQYLDSALFIGKAIGDKEILKYVYNKFAVVDSNTGNFKSAFQNYKTYVTYCDSLKNEENTKKIVSEQMQYEFDKKQAGDKATQDKKDAIDQANKRKQQIVTGAVSLGLLLVIIFSGLLFSRFRVTQRQKLVIEHQKALVEEKNKEVLDSITYAKRLQDAILPPLSIIQKYLPESFVLYKPKDIVAGDFYWVAPLPPKGVDNTQGSGFPPLGEEKGAVLIAACDCTGHGVPGAMVSVVCSNALNRAVKEFKIRDTGKVLDKVRELVLETFEKSESNVQDGMDISFCAITSANDGKGAQIEWSGAYNPLWYIQNGEMKEVTADKQPIGKTDNPKQFTTHTLGLNKGDSLYLFTDGYADQFGGPKGKKFKYKTLQEKLLAISSQPIDKQKEELETTLEAWKGKLEQVDDILIIGIRV